jgi:hypothetical protein
MQHVPTNSAKASQFEVWLSLGYLAYVIIQSVTMLMIGTKLNKYHHLLKPIRRAVTDQAEDDFDVLPDGAVVGRIFKANAAPGGPIKIP